VLREYWQEYRPRKWLFSGQEKEKHITARTVISSDMKELYEMTAFVNDI
jgi:hypothetical protein